MREEVKCVFRQQNVVILAGILFILMMIPVSAYAAPVIPNLNIDVSTANDPQDVSASLQVLALLTVLSLVPSILIMTTSFVRIVVVLSFLRSAMGTQSMPPNQVVLALALFLTFFIMSPYIHQANQQGFQPYLEGQITQEQAVTEVVKPMREFMFRQTRESDLALFVNISQAQRPNSQEEVPTLTLIPAFIISELKTAFQMGFIIYIPFIVIDMIVASTLMSMGMMMLPPITISLPFKILLFVMVDGWHLLIQSLIVSFK